MGAYFISALFFGFFWYWNVASTWVRFIYVVIGFFCVKFGLASEVAFFLNGSRCGDLTELSIREDSEGTKTVNVKAEHCTFTPQPPDNEIDPVCNTAGMCETFELPIDQNIHYDGSLEPGHLALYHFVLPARSTLQPPEKNLFFSFHVVGNGGFTATLNTGISRVAGRVNPGIEEAVRCFQGPGKELSVYGATDDASYPSTCLLMFATDYFFSIENTDGARKGYYRFTFASVPY